MFTRNFMRSFPVKKYARQSAAGNSTHNHSRNHQYRYRHARIQRSHPLQSRNLRLSLPRHGLSLLRIRLLLRSHQTRPRSILPRSTFSIMKDLVRKRPRISQRPQPRNNLKLEQNPRSQRLDQNFPSSPMITKKHLYPKFLPFFF